MNFNDLLNKIFGRQASSLEEQQTNDARSSMLKREFAEHPSKGLTPAKLYQILEAAEKGDLKAQHELFDDMEEKDPQIGSDLAKRRQLASELEWQIVPPDNATRSERMAAEHAAEVFGGIEVEDLIIDMGAAIGHGWANLEMSWNKDGAYRYIAQPEIRPHSWFRLHPDDQTRLMLRDMSATGAELWPLGWVRHVHRAKPGYIARCGLHRMLAWPYLFQNYALGDLAQLLEIYGIPARIGQYPKNATDKEKATLLRAVTSLGSNAAGIFPEGMKIEFLEAANGKSDVFETMLNWCERAKAKVILGGTLTSGTGEGTNTNALGNVHERGLQSLIRSDVRQYAGTIRRDIIWPMAMMNFGITDMRRAPRFYLDTGEAEDLKALSESLPVFVDMGVKIPTWWVHEKSRIPKAQEDEEVLTPRFSQSAALRVAALKDGATVAGGRDVTDLQVARLHKDGDVIVQSWIDQIQKAVEEADSFEDLQDRLVEMAGSLDAGAFADLMRDALAAAQLAGRYDIMERL